MNGKPSSMQKRFHEWCRERGCIITTYMNPSIHHIKGAKMRLKGVKGYAGEWYVLPLCFDYHQGKSYAIHRDKKAFEEISEGTEKEHWINLMAIHEDHFGFKPMSEEEYQIILERA